MTTHPTTWNVLECCAGIGGLSLGLQHAGMTTAALVEIDPWCRTLLTRRFPGVPLHDDVRTALQWWQSDPLRPRIDVIAAGFPCQPISTAGRLLAQDDPRWLWPAIASLVRGLRPRIVLLENVPGLLHRGMGDVAGDLAQAGYDTQWQCLQAAALGAPHRRERIFLTATAT